MMACVGQQNVEVRARDMWCARSCCVHTVWGPCRVACTHAAWCAWRASEHAPRACGGPQQRRCHSRCVPPWTRVCVCVRACVCACVSCVCFSFVCACVCARACVLLWCGAAAAR
jgi:hypothetical protein